MAAVNREVEGGPCNLAVPISFRFSAPPQTAMLFPYSEPMPAPVFIRRVVLSNFMSIARCSVELGPLTYLVGPNGAGKSNFLDSLRFISESLHSSIEHALRERGGINEVRRRSSGHPTHFGVRIEFVMPNGDTGHYAFRVGAKSQGAFEVQQESCLIAPATGIGGAPVAFFDIRSGRVAKSSLATPPAALPDRLFLVNVSGIPAFRPLYDALHHMGFYNLNPDAIRELQPPDPGDILAPDGRNLASVLKRIMEHDESVHARVMKLLADVVPGVTGVEHLPLGNKESFEFRQVVGSNPTPWRFPADNMSDGTLRALGVLVALFQPPISADKSVPLVGIEEPESALHPGAAAVLRTALREAAQRKQLLITSHSPDLLDDKEIPQESIYAVTNRAGETLISPLDETSRSALHDRLFTAGELLRLNQLEADEGYVERLPATQLELFKTD